MLEIIAIAILMLVVAISGRKQGGGYYGWAKVLFVLLIAWMLLSFYFVGQALLELEEMLR